MSGDGRELALIELVAWDKEVVYAREEGAHGQSFEFPFSVIEGLNGSHPRELKNFSPKGFLPGIWVWVERNFATVIKVSPVIIRPRRP